MDKVKSQFQSIVEKNAELLFSTNSELFKGIKMPDGKTIDITAWKQLEGIAKNNPEFYKSSLFNFIALQ